MTLFPTMDWGNLVPTPVIVAAGIIAFALIGAALIRFILRGADR